MKQDDLQIVHAIRGGDSAAFTALVEKHKKAVYGVILPKVRDLHQAQDLTSNLSTHRKKSVGGCVESRGTSPTSGSTGRSETI